jgi:hypothetical protein
VTVLCARSDVRGLTEVTVEAAESKKSTNAQQTGRAIGAMRRRTSVSNSDEGRTVPAGACLGSSNASAVSREKTSGDRMR